MIPPVASGYFRFIFCSVRIIILLPGNNRLYLKDHLKAYFAYFFQIVPIPDSERIKVYVKGLIS